MRLYPATRHQFRRHHQVWPMNVRLPNPEGFRLRTPGTFVVDTPLSLASPNRIPPVPPDAGLDHNPILDLQVP